ncbi:MAG TPA: hypothetical protein EYP68_00150 [Candidatus Korarchaeota archaeon]|nr:hypothetical protein [Candidatus Korarchaeota archaeon]
MPPGPKRAKCCFRDRDYFMDKEGMFFCVIGNIHPPDRVISYLKYVPEKISERTRWKKGDIGYDRILPYYSTIGVLSTQEYLSRRKPEYLYRDPFMNILITAVPIDSIELHFLPENRVAQILSQKTRDPLEEEVAELVTIFGRECGIETNCFGLTGSLLIGIHDPSFSDIDLIVYRRENSQKLLEELPRLFERYDELEPFGGDLLKRRIEEVSKIYFLEPEVAAKLCKRKKDRGLFKGRQFSIHPVKTEKEVEERYGLYKYESLDIVTITGVVEDCSDSMFLPSKYIIRDAKTIEGKPLPDVKEIVSYEGLYSMIADEGDEIIARGKLESVRNLENGSVYYRVLIGSFEAKGRDFVLPKSWL